MQLIHLHLRCVHHGVLSAAAEAVRKDFVPAPLWRILRAVGAAEALLLLRGVPGGSVRGEPAHFRGLVLRCGADTG